MLTNNILKFYILYIIHAILYTLIFDQLLAAE